MLSRGSLCLQPVSALAGGQKASPHPHALTANLLSFGIGLELNTHCTNTQIRLIGLVCLVLWYAGPWLCRKLREVQNAQ